MPKPPTQPPRGNKQVAGVGVKWWVIGGVVVAGFVYYEYKKQSTATTAAATDPTIDPATGLPYDATTSYGTSPSDPVGVTPGINDTTGSAIPAGATVTYTAPDGSTETIQPSLPTAPTLTTADPAGVTTPAATPAPSTVVVRVASVAPAVVAPITNATWMAHADQVLTHHGYTHAAVAGALAKYLTMRPLYPHEVAIVEAATRWIGPAPHPPSIHQIPEPKRPAPKPKPRKKATH